MAEVDTQFVRITFNNDFRVVTFYENQPIDLIIYVKHQEDGEYYRVTRFSFSSGPKAAKQIISLRGSHYLNYPFIEKILPSANQPAGIYENNRLSVALNLAGNLNTEGFFYDIGKELEIKKICLKLSA